MGLGRKGIKGAVQLTATEAMERHRNRLKDKEVLIERVRVMEAKIKNRKEEIKSVVDSNELMRCELEKQAQWRDMLGI